MRQVTSLSKALRQGFNLGAMPSKLISLSSRPHRTIEALKKLCGLLVSKVDELLLIYYGHEGGDLERDAVLDFV